MITANSTAEEAIYFFVPHHVLVALHEEGKRLFYDRWNSMEATERQRAIDDTHPTSFVPCEPDGP